MVLYATIYDLKLRHLESPVHSRIDCYVRLKDGRLIVLTEEGKTGRLSKKYEFEILKSDFSAARGRPCKLIKDAHGIRFNKFIDD